MSETLITCWRLKYDVGFWRPFQAIHGADTDGNPATDPDPGWPADRQPGVLRLRQRPRLPDLAGRPDHPSDCSASNTTLTLHSYNTKADRMYPHPRGIEHDAFHARIWGGLHFRTAMEDATPSATKRPTRYSANSTDMNDGTPPSRAARTRPRTPSTSSETRGTAGEVTPDRARPDLPRLTNSRRRARAPTMTKDPPAPGPTVRHVPGSTGRERRRSRPGHPRGPCVRTRGAPDHQPSHQRSPGGVRATQNSATPRELDRAQSPQPTRWSTHRCSPVISSAAPHGGRRQPPTIPRPRPN